jgi:NADPH:quinone reductase-like Zn-dependent oxidoreductase
VKAVVLDRYGPPSVLRVEEVETPSPNDDELLVRVRAAAVTRTDSGNRAAHPILIRAFTGLRRPKHRIPGNEFAGEVAAVGAAVTEFAVGDRVFGTTGFARGGSNAEYVCVRETQHVAHLPDSIDFEQGASLCEGPLYALMALRGVHLRAGQEVLVYGASGAIGTASVQLAKHFVAHVTAVCSTRNVELVRSLGPDRVIDYTREDFTAEGERYDVIHDAVGKHSFLKCRRALKPGGIYLASDLGFLWHALYLAPLTWLVGTKRLMPPISPFATKQDVVFLRDLVVAGQFRPVIDRRYRLDQIVEAATYVDTGKKTGNVVLTIGGHVT